MSFRLVPNSITLNDAPLYPVYIVYSFFVLDV